MELPLVVHSSKAKGIEKALDLINKDTGAHIIPKYESFCINYAQHFKPRLAMEAAGYPVDERTDNAMRLAFRVVLRRRDVQLRIQALIHEKADNIGVSSDWVVMKWLEVLDRCMQKEQVLNSKGEWNGEWKFDARGANIVLENMAKYFGMFTKDNTSAKPVQVNCYFGGKIEKEAAPLEGEVVSG